MHIYKNVYIQSHSQKKYNLPIPLYTPNPYRYIQNINKNEKKEMSETEQKAQVWRRDIKSLEDELDKCKNREKQTIETVIKEAYENEREVTITTDIELTLKVIDTEDDNYV